MTEQVRELNAACRRPCGGGVGQHPCRPQHAAKVGPAHAPGQRRRRQAAQRHGRSRQRQQQQLRQQRDEVEAPGGVGQQRECAPLQMQRRQAHRQRQRQDQMHGRLQRPGQCQHDTHRQPGQGHPGCQAPGGRQAHPGGLRVHIQRLRHAEGRQRGAELDDRFELVELPLLGRPERLAQPHGGQQQRDTATTLQQQGPRQLALERQGSRPKRSLDASANRLDASRRRPNGRTAAAAPNSACLARRTGQAPP